MHCWNSPFLVPSNFRWKVSALNLYFISTNDVARSSLSHPLCIAIKQERMSAVYIAPTMYEYFMLQKPFHGKDFASLKNISGRWRSSLQRSGISMRRFIFAKELPFTESLGSNEFFCYFFFSFFPHSFLYSVFSIPSQALTRDNIASSFFPTSAIEMRWKTLTMALQLEAVAFYPVEMHAIMACSRACLLPPDCTASP